MLEFDEEINALKNALYDLNEKEQKRMEELEYESKTFKKILNKEE